METITQFTIDRDYFCELESLRDYPLVERALGKYLPEEEYERVLGLVADAAAGKDNDVLDFIGYLQTHREQELEGLWDVIDALIRDYITYAAQEVALRED